MKKRKKVKLTRKTNGYWRIEHINPPRKFEIGDVVVSKWDMSGPWDTMDEVRRFVDPQIVTGFKLKNKRGQGCWEYELDNFGSSEEDQLVWHPNPDPEKIRGFSYMQARK